MSGEVLAFPQAPDGVEVRHLRAFVAVAEELNFGRAAARLYVSQPALSRQIRALERLVGCELLRRSTHRVELTVAGSALLDRARRLLADLDEAIATTQSVGGELANRMATLWAPVLELASADQDIEAMRTAYEEFLAQAQPPEGVTVIPAHAGGVPALCLRPPRESGVAASSSARYAGGPDTPAARPAAANAAASSPARPAAGVGEPAMLFLHGGGFAVGSAYGYRALVGALVAAAGVPAVVPDYRLAPEHPFPAALEDALSAYRWLVEQRGADRVVLVGDSVGGGLCCSLLLTLRDEGLPLPAGAVLLCPAVDLVTTSTDDEEQDAALRRTSDAYLSGHPADDPLVSPLRGDLTGLPPLLVQTATGDFVLPEARRLVEKATAQGVDARLELYPADTHVFHVFWSFLPEATDALQQAGAFIRERLGRPVSRDVAGA